jgi:ribose-phosphate pyrophosphokinase
MRQDKRFNPGEAVSAPIFARFLEESFDWLVTADPHLHRNPDLSALYKMPVRRVVTAPAIADWIRENVTNAVLIGPDSESEQWVSDIARRANMPYQTLHKVRRGDREVDVSLPAISEARDRTPVIVDDIASSGQTIIETLGHLKKLGLPPAVLAVCVCPCSPTFPPMIAASVRELTAELFRILSHRHAHTKPTRRTIGL